ncbi:MAG: PDZ domain-containing protein, partial [Dokdonella sp.]
IAAVAPESAAKRAGLRENDRITAIDGVAIATRALASWRGRLRELPAGTRLPIEFERDGKPGRADLVLADRIPAQR